MTAPWTLPDFDDHEGVHLFRDAAAGLTAIIAIHSTHLGSAAGGTRVWHYADPEAAIVDALRLSRGMSYKNALAGLPLGGGKGVILADAAGKADATTLAAFGRAVETLGGRYVTAEDVGMSMAGMLAIAAETKFVSGLPPLSGQAGGSPGPSTAMGVFLGIKAAVRRALGRDDLRGVHVAIQGIGAVGGGAARLLAAEGARLTLADLAEARAQALAAELGAAVVPADTILAIEADVISPCALGAVFDEASIAALQAPIVAGGANNQLATAADGDRLHARGILYAPDYVINAGGIINVSVAYLGETDPAVVKQRLGEIPERLEAIWAESAASNVAANRVADAMAQRLIGR